MPRTAPAARVVQSRQVVIEVTVSVGDAPTMRANGTGDLFVPRVARFRYAQRGDGTAGDLLMPVSLHGPAVAARVDGPFARSLTIVRTGLVPVWLVQIAEWARGARVRGEL
jgi:hypothetical protein